ncbi:MAG: T9SS type A sorting domain-containing protein, partial [Bacteroidales bacterium]|nr:T9SS type A sorting domain-containing protein [Bacteroidales bacterium]
SNFGCMSHYVFSEVTETDYTCTIPFVYEEMQDGVPLAPVQFHYIPDFIKSYTITDITPEHINPVTSVDQNYPNPFQGSTSIQINLLRSSDLVMEVHNIAGQMVKTIDLGKVSKGLHDIVLNAEDLNPGIYFYTLDTGKDRITKKMIIR